MTNEEYAHLQSILVKKREQVKEPHAPNYERGYKAAIDVMRSILSTQFKPKIEEVRPTGQVWHYPETDLPTSMDFVLALISGRANGRQCEQAPFIASFAPDDGWMLESIPDDPDDSWKVIKWMEIPWEETK